MRGLFTGMMFFACIAIAIFGIIDVILIKAPIYFGFLFAHEPDPTRPGHTRGVVVTMPELLLSILITVMAVASTVWIWKYRPDENSPFKNDVEP